MQLHKVRDRGSCSPRYLRSTLNHVPHSTELLTNCAMPLALVVSPLALPDPGDEPIQVGKGSGDGGQPFRYGMLFPFLMLVPQCNLHMVEEITWCMYVLLPGLGRGRYGGRPGPLRALQGVYEPLYAMEQLWALLQLQLLRHFQQHPRFLFLPPRTRRSAQRCR